MLPAICKDPFHYIPWGLSKPNINDLWSVVLQKIFKELAKKYTKLPIIPSKENIPTEFEANPCIGSREKYIK